MQQEYRVTGTQIGQNGMFYGNWCRWVIAESPEAAKTEAVRIVKAQGGYTAWTCEALSATPTRTVEPCTACGQYH